MKPNRSRRLFLLAAASLLAACGRRLPFAPVTPSATALPSATPLPTVDPIACRQPVIAPTQPAVIPGYAQLDETTNLHMTGRVQQFDASTFRLKISGLVEHPMELTLDDLRCLPKITQRVTTICPGYFEDVATWSGTLLKPLLEQAGIKAEAVSMRLLSPGYESFLLIEEALREDNFLAYEWEGEPLPILHGYPLRAVMPSFYGAKSTKWLTEISIKK
jgi:DMSO/TMAO reductase YedYZ molybdopterin-dependent catalytic subunit